MSTPAITPASRATIDAVVVDIGRNRRQRGDIGSVPQVLLQGARNHPASLGQLVGTELHQHAAAGIRLCANAGSVSG